MVSIQSTSFRFENEKLPFSLQVLKMQHFFFSGDTNVDTNKINLYAQIAIYNSKFLSFFLTVSFRLILFKLMVDCCNASISLIELFSFAAFPSILNGRSGPFWTSPYRGPLGVRRTGGTIPGVLLLIIPRARFLNF
jgi:hypothetical protein